jgi:transposase-like protein
MRTRMSPELQAHVRRLYEETDQPVCQIALDVGVNESVIRRMGPREGWVRFEAPPRDLPPVAKLLAQVEELEKAGAVQERARQDDGEAPQDDGDSNGATREENIARFTQVVMAHLDEFEAMRRDGKLLPTHHLATARAISILTEAFNRLARLRAALPGTIHDDLAADMPADLDAFREELAQRIETFLASRTDAGAFIDAAAASAAAAE